MNSYISPEIITVVILIFSVVFTVFLYFRKPQEQLDKQQALNKEEEKNRAALLTRELELERTSNERRFKEGAEALTASQLLATNHINHVDAKVDVIIKGQGQMAIDIAKLFTIIDERIPKKI